ncbi:hypothetical protein OG427_02975 [Streptomyces sp. NBC_00133]|uniref:hypothetical protein n=1 Tax=Streptomyces sp. NBC_00133 TaxID=2903624 RepID=UPI00324F3706
MSDEPRLYGYANASADNQVTTSGRPGARRPRTPTFGQRHGTVPWGNVVPEGFSSRPIELRFQPVENGMDYLLSVSECLADEPTPRELKYAVLHLQAAVEVLLKARLAGEHWALVFDKIENASREKFVKGDFRSCSTPEALKRLEVIAGLDLGVSGGIENDLKQLVKWRNALQHYGLTEPAPAVEKISANILDFLLTFVHDHLRPSLAAEDLQVLNRQIGLVGDGLAQIKRFLSTRWNRLRGELTPLLDDTVACPLCQQEALLLGVKAPPCRFCLVIWPNGEEAAFTYVETVLNLDVAKVFHDNGASLVNECPNCSADALVSGIKMASGRQVTHLCFQCGVKFGELEPCWDCGLPYTLDVDSNGQCKKCGGVGKGVPF